MPNLRVFPNANTCSGYLTLLFSLTFGNGAIFLDSDLKSCSTSSSETFSNPDLLTNQNTSCPFEVQTLEIFTFIQEELE